MPAPLSAPAYPTVHVHRVANPPRHFVVASPSLSQQQQPSAQPNSIRQQWQPQRRGEPDENEDDDDEEEETWRSEGAPLPTPQHSASSSSAVAVSSAHRQQQRPPLAPLSNNISHHPHQQQQKQLQPLSSSSSIRVDTSTARKLYQRPTAAMAAVTGTPVPFVASSALTPSSSSTPLSRTKQQQPSPAVAAAAQRVSLVARALATGPAVARSAAMRTTTTTGMDVTARPENKQQQQQMLQTTQQQLELKLTAATATAVPATATRMLMLEDGSAFGQWSDGCSLLLHPGARTANLLMPDGTSMRVLAATVPSAARPKLVSLLAFRNLLCGGLASADTEATAPVVDREAWAGETFVSNKAYPFARWALQASSSSSTTNSTEVEGEQQYQELESHQLDESTRTSALTTMTSPSRSSDTVQQLLRERLPRSGVTCPQVVHLPDGSIRVSAMDPHVSLTLLPNAHWVRLEWPVCLSRSVARVHDHDGSMSFEYLYASFTQLLPIQAVPAAWRCPLLTALEASHVHQIEREERRIVVQEEQQQQQKQQQQQLAASNPPSSCSIINTTAVSSMSELSELDLVMDLPRALPLRPASTHPNHAPAPPLHWPEVAGHSVSILHSMPNSLPRGSIVRALWTPQALFWLTNEEPPPSTASSSPTADEQHQVSVCALIHVDQSCLILKSNGFFEHFLQPLPEGGSALTATTSTTTTPDDGSTPTPFVPLHVQSEGGFSLRKKVYAARLVPRLHNGSGLNAHEVVYELGSIAEAMTRLADHAKGVLDERQVQAQEAARLMRALHAEGRAQPGGSSGGDNDLSISSVVSASSSSIVLPPSELRSLSGLTAASIAASASREVVFSSRLVERSMVRSMGEFSAFADGRIKVRFVDRTLLELNTSRTEANMLLPNGMALSVTIPSAEATKWEQDYLQPALQFARWAFLTPEQRLREQREEALRREKIEHEVQQARRALVLARIQRGEDAGLEEEQVHENQQLQQQQQQCIVAATGSLQAIETTASETSIMDASSCSTANHVVDDVFASTPLIARIQQRWGLTPSRTGARSVRPAVNHQPPQQQQQQQDGSSLFDREGASLRPSLPSAPCTPGAAVPLAHATADSLSPSPSPPALGTYKSPQPLQQTQRWQCVVTAPPSIDAIVAPVPTRTDSTLRHTATAADLPNSLGPLSFLSPISAAPHRSASMMVERATGNAQPSPDAPNADRSYQLAETSASFASSHASPEQQQQQQQQQQLQQHQATSALATNGGDPLYQTLSANDVSFWLADLQYRNDLLQQQLQQASKRIGDVLPVA